MGSRPRSSPWGDDYSDDEESDRRRLLEGPVTAYQATEEQIVRDHEQGLNKLGEAIKRQKYIANELATEVDVQNEIIDDIDNGMVRTGENLRKNTRNINLITKKSSTFYLWLLIVILALVIVGLAIL